MKKILTIALTLSCFNMANAQYAAPIDAAKVMPVVAAISGYNPNNLENNQNKAQQTTQSGQIQAKIQSQQISQIQTSQAQINQAQATREPYTYKTKYILYSCNQWNTYRGGKLTNPQNKPGAKYVRMGEITQIEQNGWSAIPFNQDGNYLGFGGAVMGIEEKFDLTGKLISSGEPYPAKVGFCESRMN